MRPPRSSRPGPAASFGARSPHAGIHTWCTAARFALSGLAHAWRTQPNFRTEVGCAALAIILAVLLRVPLTPILLSCALVLSLELVNTAIEAVVDLVSPEFHPLAKIAKDAGAGAVLLASVFALLVGASEFLPRLWSAAGM
ncbi:diacylglycerol kinase [Deinococcus peraridilitoris]|uniref:Diacylglycerol kinase n=1 Tax=Deinococcus peraridilitoris (strain DSM 19664 / LMG 22246 / CIP 109416 / KR-200) TaxID=937777 RepID=K9ZW28_DEIPD|nr:diacylglycerol kinase family protein [Deinococcus peraridilitoris]AFZ65843.1 diacylglycerol kinase [Deinococcus peraridilitoris DSM 19664]